MMSFSTGRTEQEGILERFFRFRENNTSWQVETLAGLTTFVTMAYIILVNPVILGDAGLDKGAVFMATALATAISTLFMGLYANYPFALAPAEPGPHLVKARYRGRPPVDHDTGNILALLRRPIRHHRDLCGSGESHRDDRRARQFKKRKPSSICRLHGHHHRVPVGAPATLPPTWKVPPA